MEDPFSGLAGRYLASGETLRGIVTGSGCSPTISVIAPDSTLPDVLRLEWEVGRREPYRSVARLFHLVGRKRSPE